MEVITIEAGAWKALHHQLNRIEQIAHQVKTPDVIMTIEDVMEYLKVGYSWVYTRRQKLHAFKEGGVIRFRKSEIDKYIKDYQL